MSLSYQDIYEQRVKDGTAKSTKPQGDNNSMRIEGVNDPSDSKFPIMPEKPSPQLPVDDPYLKLRTQKT